MFTYNTQIFLHHTDAAGRLFFAHQFVLIHEAKEKFLESLGLSITDFVEHPTLSFPLIHAESDYKAMLKAGDKIAIQVRVEKVGETSVTFLFSINKEDGTCAGTAKTVNVAVDKASMTKVPLPAFWRTKFSI